MPSPPPPLLCYIHAQDLRLSTRHVPRHTLLATRHTLRHTRHMLHAQNLRLVPEAYGDPVGLRRAPLQLVDLARSVVGKDRIHVDVLLRAQVGKVPDQGLRD